MHGIKIGFLLPVFVGLTMMVGCATKSQPASTASDSPAQTSAAGAQSAATNTGAPAATAPVKPTGPRKRTDPPPKPDISCLKGDDSRVLAIEEVRTGCWLFYVNRGIKKRIAWSKNGNSHCEKVRDQIRVSLEKGGYSCKWNE